MSILNLAKKYVIDSQIFVSLMGTMMAGFFMLEQNIFRWPSLLLIFITYFSGYLYTKYQNRKKTFIKILIFNFICGILSFCLIVFNHNEIRLLKWAVIVVIGLLYNSFFLEKFIRKIPLLKIFYVGLTWALINAWLILPEFNWEIFWISWLFISALVLPFDIRDMKSDDVVTFPILIGVQKTKYLAYLLVFVSCLLSLVFLDREFSLSFLLTTVFTFILIYFSENDNKGTYFSFWVESCSGLPLLVILLYWLAN
ncbi:UbiA family prenyltransferase [Epilithonimonas xixisoli]|uniref:UbiA prenyltransferase family protein n=1 Tax=Epilithonimonas xixisoli TaxID=1476462 RepID=A0A4R8IDB3_9FLAO|nr:UbiA family prenyltransferase [Epilithonimonas xixisoli]TDX83069.1 hypothetical protein B0I22_3128 [Epilithonimonas xixisoli]